MTLWCRATAAGCQGSQTGSSVVIAGTRAPDLAAVDELARWMLGVTRAGGSVVIEYVAPKMAELLDLSGLSIEVQGQAEGRKQPQRVQRLEKEGELGDLLA